VDGLRLGDSAGQRIAKAFADIDRKVLKQVVFAAGQQATKDDLDRHRAVVVIGALPEDSTLAFKLKDGDILRRKHSHISGCFTALDFEADAHLPTLQCWRKAASDAPLANDFAVS
jgi:hypothetical protein